MTEQTSRLVIVVDTTNAQQRLAQFRQSLRQTSAMASNAGINLQGLSGQAQTLGSSANNTTTQLSGTNNQLLAIARNANNASRGVNGLVNPLSRINDLLRRTQAIISGGLFGIFALSVAKTADTMQDLNSQIMLVTKNEQEQLVVTERLHQMANKNLTDLKSTIGLYTNSARALGNLLQLGQAMQSGVLQGDEFRSLAENAPIREYNQFKNKLAEEVAKIQKAGFDPQTTADLIGRAEEKINAELSRWRYAQAEETFNAKIHEYSELEKLDFAYTKKRNDILTDEKFLYGLNAEQKQAMLDAVDSAYQYDLAKYQLNLAEKTAGLFDYQKTELQLINEKYDLEAQKIRLNGESKALQDLQLADNEEKRKKEISDKQKSASENFNALNAEVSGVREYFDLHTQLQNRLEIIKEALNAEVIVKEQAEKAKLKLEQDYMLATQQLQLSQYASVADNVAVKKPTILKSSTTPKMTALTSLITSQTTAY